MARRGERGGSRPRAQWVGLRPDRYARKGDIVTMYRMGRGYVRAYHLIVTTYGFWLPNDPRGSWSKWVRSWELSLFGDATTTGERRSLAYDAHDRARRLMAKQVLVRDPVVFSGVQARAVARGFADYIARSGCIVHACAVMPDHAHLVVQRHRYSIEQIANLLKGAATRGLIAEGLHPFLTQPYSDGTYPTPWARRQWSCFLGDDQAIERAIAYVERNALKLGFRAQTYAFVHAFRA